MPQTCAPGQTQFKPERRTSRRPPPTFRHIAGFDPYEARAEAWARRKRLAKDCPIPSHLARHFTTARLAVLHVLGLTCAAKKQSNMSLPEIAGRAGVGCTIARYAIRQAAEMGLISVQENGVRGKRNLPNTIRIVALSWKRWIKNGIKWKRQAEQRKKSAEAPGANSEVDPLTNLRPTADKLITAERDKPAPVSLFRPLALKRGIAGANNHQRFALPNRKVALEEMSGHAGASQCPHSRQIMP